jgi:anthranilate synthase / indole-3-glycerol phosphate synthase / phosphoribosylanthranilate isomerase
LIVACLEDSLLLKLMEYSRMLGMEPLVEVATNQEMERAVTLGATIIGINNRDLNTFQVDMDRTKRLSSGLDDKNITLIALSGIQTRSDVENYINSGAKGILVGEALMRSKDKNEFIHSLLGRTPKENLQSDSTKPLVKICGITNLQDAVDAINLGADLLGFIFAKESPRFINPSDASKIVQKIRETYGLSYLARTDSFIERPRSIGDAFTSIPKKISIIGVFTSSTIDEINDIVRSVCLDLVQLHTPRSKSFQKLVSRPIIQVIGMKKDVHVLDRVKQNIGSASYILLDTETEELVGGTGKTFEWNAVKELSDLGVCVWMAGGLTPENVGSALPYQPTVIDVCSGVEAKKGMKDLKKMKSFLCNAKQ